MPSLTAPDGLTFEYDTFGNAADPTVLLVCGLGGQMTSWSEGFCRRIADAGRHVVCFDNRDCGLSTKFDGVAVDLADVVAALRAGGPAAARRVVPYTLSDMAADAVAVLDGLGIDRAHVVGVSMGGMIAQTVAIEHAERVLTLTSIMSMTGEPEYGAPSPEARAFLMAPPPPDRATFIERSTDSLVWMSKRYADPAEVRRSAAAAYDRSFSPEGTARQFMAVVASGSRADGLRALDVPTLVIHGLDDTLIDPSGGRRTAELVPGARLLLLEDMGHDRPEPLWPDLCGAIVSHTAAPGPGRAPGRRTSG